MAEFSENLEKTLHTAIKYANSRKHEFATLEHLLLALIEDEDASAVIKICTRDIEALKKNVQNYVDEDLKALERFLTENNIATPTAGFHRVVQRASIHVQGRNEEVIRSQDVLLALFSERESNAVYFLQEQDMTRYDAYNLLINGIEPKAGRLSSVFEALAAVRDPLRARLVGQIATRGGLETLPTAFEP